MNRFALVAVAVVALALLAGCDGGEDDRDVEPIDATALLRAAADRMDQVRSFHFVLEHEGGSTEIVSGIEMIRAEGDVVGSDRLRVEIEGRFARQNINTGVVVIGEESWLLNPLTRRWQRVPITLGGVFDPATGVTALMRAATDAEVTAIDRVDGVATYRVEAMVDSGEVRLFGEPRAGQLLRATAWIGVDDPLLYRIEVAGAVTAADEAGLVRRLTLSGFDAEVEIAPPR